MLLLVRAPPKEKAGMGDIEIVEGSDSSSAGFGGGGSSADVDVDGSQGGSVGATAVVRIGQPIVSKRLHQTNILFTTLAAGVTKAAQVEKTVEIARLTQKEAESKAHDQRKGATQLDVKTSGRCDKSMRPCTDARWKILHRSFSPEDKLVMKFVDRQIWCGACGDYIREDNCPSHCATPKHMGALKKAILRHQVHTSMEEAIRRSSLTTNVTTKTHLYRCDLARTTLMAGAPTWIVDEYREHHETWTLMEGTHSSHLMRDYLPIITAEEIKTLLLEIFERPLVVFFDETTLLYLMFCVIIGFVDDYGRKQKRVVKLNMYDESPEERLTNGMSSYVISVIEDQLHHPRHLIKAFIRDGVAINELAIKKLIGGMIEDPNTRQMVLYVGVYDKAANIKCFSHTMDNTGANYTRDKIVYNRIEGPYLTLFYNKWHGLFVAAGNGPSNQWKRAMSSAMATVGGTRWWEREELHEYTYWHIGGGEGVFVAAIVRAIENAILSPPPQLPVPAPVVVGGARGFLD